jgi:hypothetical protein
MDKRGMRIAQRLSLITAPPKMAMAICGAKPKGRPSQARYNADTTTKRIKETNIDLLIFICKRLWAKIIKNIYPEYFLIPVCG